MSFYIKSVEPLKIKEPEGYEILDCLLALSGCLCGKEWMKAYLTLDIYNPDTRDIKLVKVTAESLCQILPPIFSEKVVKNNVYIKKPVVTKNFHYEAQVIADSPLSLLLLIFSQCQYIRWKPDREDIYPTLAFMWYVFLAWLIGQITLFYFFT